MHVGDSALPLDCVEVDGQVCSVCTRMWQRTSHGLCHLVLPLFHLQVVLKIVKHCQQALPSFVTGQLLGLDIGRSLEVTNTFAFPTAERADSVDDELAEYQMEMMRCLREVNVDNNTVGWYQSTYFSSFIDESCVETQFNYQVRACYLLISSPGSRPTLRTPRTVSQSNIKSAVVLIYDPSRTSGVALRAFRLTDTFMQLYGDGKVTYDALASANQSAGADVFQEMQITVRNSHLNSALLLELQDECGIKCAHSCGASAISRHSFHACARDHTCALHSRLHLGDAEGCGHCFTLG